MTPNPYSHLADSSSTKRISKQSSLAKNKSTKVNENGMTNLIDEPKPATEGVNSSISNNNCISDTIRKSPRLAGKQAAKMDIEPNKGLESLNLSPQSYKAQTMRNRTTITISNWNWKSLITNWQISQTCSSKP